MEKKSEKTAGKVVAWWLVVLALVGGGLISALADFSDKSGAMPRLFVFFLSALIVVQIIPALMLLGAMCKGIAGLAGKKTKTQQTNTPK